MHAQDLRNDERNVAPASFAMAAATYTQRQNALMEMHSQNLCQT